MGVQKYMNKKGEGIGLIVIIFIGIIVGLAFLNEITTQQGAITTKSGITNESIDISSVRNSTHSVVPTTQVNIGNPNTLDAELWKQTKCPIENFVLRNQSNFTGVSTTDYIFTASIGNFTVLNTAVFNNTARNGTYATYTHCRDGYLTDDSTRGVANLWNLFGALIILGFVLIGVKSLLDNK